MKIVIDISEDDYRKVKDGRASVSIMRKAITNGTPHETVTEFADRCRECGREKVLDKIKVETTNIPITDTDGHNNNWYREPQAIINDVLQIIDKYKSEREDKG